MATELLTEKYSDALHGVLNCYDRVLITGHVQPWSYAQAMTSYLYQHEIRIFDYSKFAQPLGESVRAHAEALAQENGVEIEFVRRAKHFRKEKRIKQILKARGDHPGLVHIFSAMESCPAYRPWHDKSSGKTYIKAASGECLHYYFYFIDEDLGLCYVRVPGSFSFAVLLQRAQLVGKSLETEGDRFRTTR